MRASQSVSLLAFTSFYLLSTVNAQFGGFGGGNNNDGGDDDDNNNNNFGGNDDGNDDGNNDFGGGDDDGGNNDGGAVEVPPDAIQQIDDPGANAEDGTADSLVSDVNFVDFCSGKILTEGQQKEGGSCNPTPMGDIFASDKIVASKFQFPANGDTINENEDFDIDMGINNVQTGTFTDPDATYYAAPQQVNQDGVVVGHSHYVIEQVNGLDSTDVLDPLNFAFFKGVNGEAQNGVLTETVEGGLPAGTYKLSSINAAANHQPVLAPIAQHGSMDDAVYFTVGNADDGNAFDGGNQDDQNGDQFNQDDQNQDDQNQDDNNDDDNDNNNNGGGGFGGGGFGGGRGGGGGGGGGFGGRKFGKRSATPNKIGGLTHNQRRALVRREAYQEKWLAKRSGLPEPPKTKRSGAHKKFFSRF